MTYKIDIQKVSENYFEDRLNDALNEIKNTLQIKAKEYVRNGDRLHNFNVGSQKSGKTREEIIASFRLKHEISIDDMRNDVAKGTLPSKELVEEKFGDVINYFILEKISILHKIDTQE